MTHSVSIPSNLLTNSPNFAVLLRDILVLRQQTAPGGALPRLAHPSQQWCRRSDIPAWSPACSCQPPSASKSMRNRMLSNTKNTHLVLLRQCLIKFTFFLLTTMWQPCHPSLLSALSIPTLQPCHLVANSGFLHHNNGVALSHVTEKITLRRWFVDVPNDLGNVVVCARSSFLLVFVRFLTVRCVSLLLFMPFSFVRLIQICLASFFPFPTSLHNELQRMMSHRKNTILWRNFVCVLSLT